MKNAQRLITPGNKAALGVNSPSREFAAIFEDDGRTAHFYALNGFREAPRILDVVHIYTLEQVSERQTACYVRIVWSAAGDRVLLTIDGYPHAVFDFVASRGYCRSNSPNFARGVRDDWRSDDHQWNDDALRWFSACDYDVPAPHLVR